jgi:hypothetical protein
MIYIASTMLDVVAGNGGKSSESNRKYPLYMVQLNERKIFAIMHYIV